MNKIENENESKTHANTHESKQIATKSGYDQIVSMI